MKSSIQDIINQAVTGKYEAHGIIGEGDCVIGFSFGYREEDNKISSGLSNEDLAIIIQEHFGDKPLIVQFEIKQALPQHKKKIFVIREHRKKGEYLGTEEVALQAIEIMSKYAWKKAILVAHPYHMPRVDALCQKLGIETIVPSGLESVRFDNKSKQEWTRNKEVWGKREEWAIREYQKMGLL